MKRITKHNALIHSLIRIGILVQENLPILHLSNQFVVFTVCPFSGHNMFLSQRGKTVYSLAISSVVLFIQLDDVRNRLSERFSLLSIFNLRYVLLENLANFICLVCRLVDNTLDSKSPEVAIRYSFAINGGKFIQLLASRTALCHTFLEVSRTVVISEVNTEEFAHLNLHNIIIVHKLRYHIFEEVFH